MNMQIPAPNAKVKGAPKRLAPAPARNPPRGFIPLSNIYTPKILPLNSSGDKSCTRV